MLRKSLVLSAILAASLNAGMFGDLAGAVTGGGNQATAFSANDIQSILTNFQQAEKGLNTSVDLINQALGDKKQLAEWAEKEKSINAMPASSEKDANFQKLKEEKVAYTEKLTHSQDVQEKAKKLSSQQKEKVSISISNLLLVALKDTEALVRSKSLVSTISSNPSYAMQYAADLPKLKNVVSTVPNQVASLGTLTSGLTTLAKNADITVKQPVSANEPMQDATGQL